MTRSSPPKVACARYLVTAIRTDDCHGPEPHFSKSLGVALPQTVTVHVSHTMHSPSTASTPCGNCWRRKPEVAGRWRSKKNATSVSWRCSPSWGPGTSHRGNQIRMGPPPKCTTSRWSCWVPSSTSSTSCLLRGRGGATRFCADAPLRGLNDYRRQTGALNDSWRCWAHAGHKCQTMHTRNAWVCLEIQTCQITNAHPVVRNSPLSKPDSVSMAGLLFFQAASFSQPFSCDKASASMGTDCCETTTGPAVPRQFSVRSGSSAPDVACLRVCR